MSSRLPLPLRVADVALRVARTAGLDALSLDPAVLLERARRRTGLHDLGDPRIEPRLRWLCESYEDEAQLSVFGRMGIRRHINNALVTRLRLVELERSEPELFETPLRDPVVIVGLPRSGTTFLHRLLVRDPAAVAFPLWDLRAPLPGPGPDHRRRDAEREVMMAARLVPDLHAKHHVNLDEPEECMFLLDPTLMSMTFFVSAPCFSYGKRWIRSDATEDYLTYRKLLQVLQARDPARRLTLKAPAHTGHLLALRAAVPEARIVQTHRDPLEAVPSLISLLRSLHTLTTRDLDEGRHAELLVEWVHTSLERNRHQRRELPAGTILDVPYAELVADPVGCARRIYAHAGVPWTADIEARMRARVRERPKDKFGTHRYSAGDFGLTPEYLARRFRRYRQDWGFSGDRATGR